MTVHHGIRRKAHFLGTKIKSLRKRNHLTLEDLSVRCVQMDAEAAYSVLPEAIPFQSWLHNAANLAAFEDFHVGTMTVGNAVAKAPQHKGTFLAGLLFFVAPVMVDGEQHAAAFPQPGAQIEGRLAAIAADFKPRPQPPGLGLGSQFGLLHPAQQPADGPALRSFILKVSGKRRDAAAGGAAAALGLGLCK